MTWWTGAALGFDTETDGPEPTEARIITGAMVLVTPGNEPNAMELMIQPERDIPQDAIDVHGITTERATQEGALREVGIAQIAATIGELACPEIPMVGHNVSYDLTLLDRELRRLELGCLVIEDKNHPLGGSVVMLIGNKPVTRFYVIDTMVIDKAVDRYRPGKRKLAVTAEHYGVPMAEGSAHGATATGRIQTRWRSRSLRLADSRCRSCTRRRRGGRGIRQKDCASTSSRTRTRATRTPWTGHGRCVG
jgi:DNA polymerase-3 subunit epsilon